MSDLAALEGFEANFAFLLRARFGDPNHAASHRVKRVFIQNDFDYLATPQPETPAHPETILGGIKYKARLSFEVEN